MARASQNLALFNGMTVLDNILLAARIGGGASEVLRNSIAKVLGL